MARLIRRNEALKRINQLEEKARATGDLAGADWIVKCFNAIRSCKVEERIFCAGCGKKIQTRKIPDEGGVVRILPGQMSVDDFL